MGLFDIRVIVQCVGGSDSRIPMGMLTIVQDKEKNGKVTINKKTKMTLIGVEWQENIEKSRSAGKMAGGAIVGTVLLGPLGGLAGGAIGAKQQKKDNSYAFLTFRDGEENEIAIKIKCDKINFSVLSAMRL